MLPRLEAERELTTINAMSLAFGGGRPAERMRYLSRLRRRAAGGQQVAAKATPAMLAAAGIGVTIVEPVKRDG